SRFRASNRRSMMHTKKKKRMVNKIQKWEKTNIVIMLDSTIIAEVGGRLSIGNLTIAALVTCGKILPCPDTQGASSSA
ncbi:MAG: hypothetical protein FWE95_06440, partial [Planctomycetaceae bacterium]|nr:hypothetical protein [Planctomycetaceae bacterium]